MTLISMHHRNWTNKTRGRLSMTKTQRAKLKPLVELSPEEAAKAYQLKMESIKKKLLARAKQASHCIDCGDFGPVEDDERCEECHREAGNVDSPS